MGCFEDFIEFRNQVDKMKKRRSGKKKGSEKEKNPAEPKDIHDD